MKTITRAQKLSVAVVMASIILAGCSGSEGSKAGGDAAPITLTLGTAEASWAPYGPGVEEFARQVEDLSDGALRIEIDWETVDWHPDAEVEVASLVRDDKLDLALVPARAWDQVGVTSLQPLQAPFLVSSDQPVSEIASDEIAADMMAGLEHVGVGGLALLPESLRHPVGYNKPIVTAGDFDGLTIRTPVSDASYRLIQALGANPVDDADFHAAVASGDLAAFESAFAWAADIPAGGTFTASITFYPKINVLVASLAAIERLDDGQRDILHEAASKVLDYVLRSNLSDDEAAEQYCASGGAIVYADDAEIAALEVAAAPVYAELEADPQTKAVIARIRLMKATTFSPDSALPAACEPATESPATAAVESADTLDGVYRWTSTADFAAAHGVPDYAYTDNDLVLFSNTFTLTLAAGRWTLETTATPRVDSGSYAVDDDRMTFTWGAVNGRTQAGDSIVLEFTVLVDDEGNLDLTEPVLPMDPGDQYLFGGHEWTKID